MQDHSDFGGRGVWGGGHKTRLSGLGRGFHKICTLHGQSCHPLHQNQNGLALSLFLFSDLSDHFAGIPAKNSVWEPVEWVWDKLNGLGTS